MISRITVDKKLLSASADLPFDRARSIVLDNFIRFGRLSRFWHLESIIVLGADRAGAVRGRRERSKELGYPSNKKPGDRDRRAACRWVPQRESR